MLNVVGKVAYTVGMSSAFACWWYRPAVDRRNGEGTRRSGSMSAIDYHDSYCRPYPWPMQVGAYVSTALVVCACRFFLYGLGKFEIKDDEHYRNFVEKCLNRDSRTPIITLPNHRSLMDDPMVLASLLPFWMNVQPHFLRWAVCAQEICFREENIVTAFFGIGGKTLPICRGEGVDQPQLLQLARKGVGTCSFNERDGCKVGCQTTGSEVRSAGWINIHAEAGIFQNKHALGGRNNGRETEIGRLKWGAAKMIVHNPSYDITEKSISGPVVIPFYVSGMDTVTPLNENKRLIQPIPVPGHSVRVRFGPELRFDDLIEEYERTEGKKLRKYHCCSDPFCQKSRFEGHVDDGTLNVSISRALSCGFEKISNSIQLCFWRVVAFSGVSISPHRTSPKNNLTPYSSKNTPISIDSTGNMMYDSETWKSTPQEKKLYSQVMLRIESAMQKLCDENKLEEEMKDMQSTDV